MMKNVMMQKSTDEQNTRTHAHSQAHAPLFFQVLLLVDIDCRSIIISRINQLSLVALSPILAFENLQPLSIKTVCDLIHSKT